MGNRKTLNIIRDIMEGCINLRRSLIGVGVNQTYDYLAKYIKIKIINIPSGKKVFDWVVPKEWVLDIAYLEIDGKRFAESENSILNVVNYSQNINAMMDWSDLKPHLHTHSNENAVPYLTTYYKKDWGFCLNKIEYKKLEKLSQGKKIKVLIKCKKINSKLKIAEYVIKGKSKKEIIVSSYVCHPEMANDSLSGVALSVAIALKFKKIQPNFTYRFVYLPETIGAIAYIKYLKDKHLLSKIFGAVVCTTVGGTGPMSCKLSFDTAHEFNDILKEIFSDNDIKFYNFDVHGSDERQYSSNGVRINSVSIYKDRFYDYDFYHTSLDNLSYVKSENILMTFSKYMEFFTTLEKRIIYKSKVEACEAMLSKRDLFPKIGGSFRPGKAIETETILEILFYSDGEKSLQKIAKITGKSLHELKRTADILEKQKVLVRL
ncbi:DUF4910 domain-containing protein [Polynucleobacter paneuropaeus]|nr:DUF4910 domain-containing protein [Polynucleobacter paneuropaeus]